MKQQIAFEKGAAELAVLAYITTAQAAQLLNELLTQTHDTRFLTE